jgi:hypothetical protein
MDDDTAIVRGLPDRGDALTRPQHLIRRSDASVGKYDCSHNASSRRPLDDGDLVGLIPFVLDEDVAGDCMIDRVGETDVVSGDRALERACIEPFGTYRLRHSVPCDLPGHGWAASVGGSCCQLGVVSAALEHADRVAVAAG